MSVLVMDEVMADPSAAEELVLSGVLRRQGRDYLLDEPPDPPPSPWPTGRIRRVDVADTSLLNLADHLDRAIVVGANPFYVVGRQHMVMRIAWLRPA